MENIFELYVEVLFGNAYWWAVVLAYYFTGSVSWIVSRTLYRMLAGRKEESLDLLGSTVQGLLLPALFWVWLRDSIHAIRFHNRFGFWPGEYGDRLWEANGKLVGNKLCELARGLHSLYESEEEVKTTIYRINPAVVPRATILARQADLAEIRKKIDRLKPRFYATRNAAKRCKYSVQERYENYLK